MDIENKVGEIMLQNGKHSTVNGSPSISLSIEIRKQELTNLPHEIQIT